ncbi:hypothetical protein [Alicyclobacillus tolerans]|nr:hypothetical protein [Alicyclobacillus montanus]
METGIAKTIHSNWLYNDLESLTYPQFSGGILVEIRDGGYGVLAVE